MIYLSFVNFIFHQLLITYNLITLNNLDIKVSALPSAPHVRLPNRLFPCVSSRTQPKRSTKVEKKKAMCHLERARPKNVRLFTEEKSGGEVKKDILIDFRRT